MEDLGSTYSHEDFFSDCNDNMLLLLVRFKTFRNISEVLCTVSLSSHCSSELLQFLMMLNGW
jgi:hypothetical protein